jgi:hypothetical protein
MSKDRSLRKDETTMREKGYIFYGTMGKINADILKQGMGAPVKIVKTDIPGYMDLYYKPSQKGVK